jgi:hypothetical protein
MHACKKKMRGEGHFALSAAMLRLINIKRTEFSTTTEFIQALKTRFTAANNLKAAIPPYLAIVIMLNQLQEIPELWVSIDIKEDKLKDVKDPVATLTKNDFFHCCSDMIDKIERIGLDKDSEQAGSPARTSRRMLLQ